VFGCATVDEFRVVLRNQTPAVEKIVDLLGHVWIPGGDDPEFYIFAPFNISQRPGNELPAFKHPLIKCQTTVVRHYYADYNINLQFPNMPCISGHFDTPCIDDYFPLELLMTCPSSNFFKVANETLEAIL
jgi:hypothetical protein